MEGSNSQNGEVGSVMSFEKATDTLEFRRKERGLSMAKLCELLQKEAKERSGN